MGRLILTFVISIFVLFFCISFVPKVNAAGLLGYWKFNQNTNDESGNGNNGTYQGANIANFENVLDGFDKQKWESQGGTPASLNTDTYVSDVPPNSGLSTTKSIKCGIINPSTGIWYACMLIKNFSSTTLPVGYTLYFWAKGWVSGDLVDTGASRTISTIYQVDTNCSTTGGSIFVTCNGNQAYTDWKLFKIVVTQSGTINPPVYLRLWNRGGDQADNTVWYDLVGTPWVPGKFNQALTFNGTNQYVLVPAAASLAPANVTVSAWAKSNTPTWSSYNALVSQRDNFILFQVVGSKNFQAYVSTYRDGAWGWKYADCIFPTGQNITDWHNYAMTYNGASLKCYLDGADVTQNTPTPASGNLSTTAHPFYIGYDYYAGSTRYINGLIDEVKIYNYALSPTELNASINNLPFGTLTLNPNPCNISAGKTTCPAAVKYDYTEAPGGVILCWNNSPVSSDVTGTTYSYNFPQGNHTFYLRSPAQLNGSWNCAGGSVLDTKTLTVNAPSGPIPTSTPTPTPIPNTGNPNLDSTIRVFGDNLLTIGAASALTPNNFMIVGSGQTIAGSSASLLEYTLPTYERLKSVYYDQFKPPLGTEKVKLDSNPDSSLINLTDKNRLYWINGSLMANTNIPITKSGVIFVDGDLYINVNLIHTVTGAGLIFIVKGNVLVNQNVTEVDALIITTGTFCSTSLGTSCVSKNPDSQLLIKGSVISLSTDKEPLFMRRIANSSQPAEQLDYQPKYLVIFKDIFAKDLKIWTERQ